MNTLTKATLEQILVQVDADPLAGRGHLTKREILVDRILAVEGEPAEIRLWQWRAACDKV